ncbi:MAG: efflux RND transporter periplasmic adaptor subunit [bacterium]
MAKIFNFFSKILKLAKQHKIVAGIVIIVILITIYLTYNAFRNSAENISYSTQLAIKGTIISSISGSGQVSASDQIDVKSKASGDIVYVGVKEGETVKAGRLIVQIDNTSSQQSVKTAQINLEKAQLTLEKMKGLTTDEGTLRGDKEKAQDALDKSYEDGFNDVSNIFLTMPSVVSDLHGIIFDSTIKTYQQNIDWYVGLISSIDTSTKPKEYKDRVITAYNLTNDAYEKNVENFRTASRESDKDTIYNLILETYDTGQKLSDAVKIMSNFIDYAKKTLADKNISAPEALTTDQNSLNGYTGTTNGYLSTLLSDKSTINNNKENLINTGFDIKDQEIQIKQLEDTLNDAKNTLENYYIRAPFDGVVATLNFKKGDSVSNGSTIATVITTQGITEIPFNEVDIIKIEIGQKTNLTFDAIDELTIVGQVVQVDVLGTVSQGVVNYNVKIAFDTQNSQIKPGMSVSADVITNVKQNVITVTNSAIKSQGDTNYVLVMENGISSQKTVEVGLSNDTNTEILSGLEEGETVITQTIISTTGTTQNNSGVNIPGITGGGGNFRGTFGR